MAEPHKHANTHTHIYINILARIGVIQTLKEILEYRASQVETISKEDIIARVFVVSLCLVLGKVSRDPQGAVDTPFLLDIGQKFAFVQRSRLIEYLDDV